jgi:phosphatidylcholine synthase
LLCDFFVIRPGEGHAVLPDSWQRLAAAAVHIFTASGIVCAFFAMLAAVNSSWAAMFAWLGMALFIDGVDGTFARAVDVKRRLPRFSGEQLDLVIDYVTYVFIPAMALHLAGLLPGVWGMGLAALILLSSLYHFSDTASKTDDHCFVGFPAIWNGVAFYLFAFSAPPWVCAVVVLACVALTFVPMRWVHPLRVEKLRTLTTAMMVVWAVAAFAVLWSGFAANNVWPLVALAIVAAYGIGLSVLSPRA